MPTNAACSTSPYSDLAAYLDCGAMFRLRNLFGFQPRLAVELGFGKAVHHVLRSVAERTRSTGAVPSKAELEQLIETNFFLPTANKAAHAQMKIAAMRLIDHYRTANEADLHRVWETERPFELHLDGIIVQSRADVILDHEGGVATGLAIVDYKTSTSGEVAAHALQLQVYAQAGRREGLDVRGTYVHDLKAAVEGRQATTTIDSSPAALAAAEAVVVDAGRRIRNREYLAAPGQRCRQCEVRTVCAAAKR
jgi:DNA helicase II / ATP-dependent DNA helicase PcrA